LTAAHFTANYAARVLDGSLVELRAHGRRALIAPETGGAIAAFFDEPGDGGGPLHWLRPATPNALAAHDPLGMASFPLLPYCNRLRDARFHFDGRDIDLSADGNAFEHALHGHAWRRPWRAGARTASSVELHFSHTPADGPAERWPFRYEASQRIELSETGLAVTMTVRNLDSRAMPFGMGHHPYYPRTPATRIHAHVAAMWHASADLLPTHLGAHPSVSALASPEGLSADAFDLDNNFSQWSGEATIAWPDERRALTLRADPAFAHTVIYAPSDRRDLLCVEPVSNTADWLNLNAAPETIGGGVLQPGESVSAEFRWIPRLDFSSPISK
jgi:aldose 1-epimerase